VDAEVSAGDLDPTRSFDPKEKELCLPQGFVIVSRITSAR
jgi:hypothetical protein